MGRFLTLIVLMILGTVAVRTQEPSPYTTNGRSNGVLWRDLSHSERVNYVDGAGDGFVRGFYHVLASQDLNPLTVLPPDWFTSTTIKNGDIVKTMDQFYQDGANISLPMITAFEYSEMKLAGATKQELDQHLTRVK